MVRDDREERRRGEGLVRRDPRDDDYGSDDLDSEILIPEEHGAGGGDPDEGWD